MAQGAFGVGLVLGKFLPPHAGHLHLIEFARARCERVVVLCCSLAQEPIAGALRAAWLTELVAGDSGVEVVHVTDENPQFPHEHPDFWSIWRDTVRRHCTVHPDAIFTSEEYGERFARELGIAHVSCDPVRSRFPVSGTRIRENPLGHWQFLPPVVRAYFARRVVLTGPESTGKTTLAQRLAAHYRTAWVPEFARVYLDEVNSRRAGMPAPPGAPSFFRPEDVEPIARGQIASEDKLARESDRVLFCDTDLLVTLVYAEFYFGSCPAWIREEAARRRYSLYLFCDTDVPWVSDAQRDQGSAAQRAGMRELFLRVLEGRNVAMISGTWEERLAKAVAATERLIAAR
jgi:NadR type nicotinamide-nucleotide adenylyltransferase